MEALRERAVRLGGIRARIAPGETESIPDRPWERSFEEWEALEPRRRYARHWRTPFLYAVTLALTPLALLVGLPVALIILLGQRNLDKIFFKQERVGRRGRLFTVLKFRTMRGGADADISDVERVTTFGRLLRNTHLDELPQFINVLRGDMCLIGPRPEMSSIESWAAKRIPGFSERLVLSRFDENTPRRRCGPSSMAIRRNSGRPAATVGAVPTTGSSSSFQGPIRPTFWPNSSRAGCVFDISNSAWPPWRTSS